MPTLTIKNTPDYIVAKLHERAKRNHRSLQGELLDIIENAALEGAKLSNEEVFARLDALNLPPTPDDSVRWIREDRDSR